VRGRRRVLAEKADELGVPFGPERRDLVAGKAVTLPGGRKVDPDEVLGELQRGSKLVVIGDTGRTDDLLEVCKDADGLVIESTYLDTEADMARQFSHLTARYAKAGVTGHPATSPAATGKRTTEGVQLSPDAVVARTSIARSR
jgi:ribonuclease Z